MSRFFYLTAVGLLILYSLSGQASIEEVIQQEKRIALVIGNGNYPDGKLANSENDSRSMAEVLQKLGFTVLKYENLTQSQMKKAIDDFGLRLQNADVGLLYYSGHGIQVKGYNYFVPVDAFLKTIDNVEYDCVQIDRVLALMELAGTNTNIVMLEACMTNPFERNWNSNMTNRGLAFMNAPKGTCISYAAAPGTTVSNISGKNGLYTSAILESILVPDITIERMFHNVRSIVAQNSQKQQIPWESTSLTEEFYFNSGGLISSNKQPQKKMMLNQQMSHFRTLLIARFLC